MSSIVAKKRKRNNNNESTTTTSSSSSSQLALDNIHDTVNMDSTASSPQSTTFSDIPSPSLLQNTTPGSGKASVLILCTKMLKRMGASIVETTLQAELLEKSDDALTGVALSLVPIMWHCLVNEKSAVEMNARSSGKQHQLQQQGYVSTGSALSLYLLLRFLVMFKTIDQITR
ncbi:hypothetical protein HDU76_006765, partial [Blyttiomyces sp. JEL0837]